MPSASPAAREPLPDADTLHRIHAAVSSPCSDLSDIFDTITNVLSANGRPVVPADDMHADTATDIFGWPIGTIEVGDDLTIKAYTPVYTRGALDQLYVEITTRRRRNDVRLFVNGQPLPLPPENTPANPPGPDPLCDCGCNVHDGKPRTVPGAPGSAETPAAELRACNCVPSCGTQPPTLVLPQWNCAFYLAPHGGLMYAPMKTAALPDWEAAGEPDARADGEPQRAVIEQALNLLTPLSWDI